MGALKRRRLTDSSIRRVRTERGLGWESVLAPHMARTEACMAAHPVVLCLQDTTELDFNGHDIDGLGSLSCEAQRGMYVHSTYAVTAPAADAGGLYNWMWARPLGTLESRRWVEGYERVAERAQKLPGTPWSMSLTACH